ncbi:MAG TPA: DUF29 family protein [Stellaceae bacterium]|nr:DUF29 family protein [Stellaceae bacterium]
MPDGPRPNGPNYDDDFYAWTQYQAEVLRGLPTSDNRYDREHVAEEIEDLGKSELHTVESQITRASMGTRARLRNWRCGIMGSMMPPRRCRQPAPTPSNRS